MDPVFIEVFGRPIYWYGVMTAAGFLAAVLHWNRLGRREGAPPGLGSELGLWVVVAGLLGARLNYVLVNLDHYRMFPGEVLRLDKGGLIFYGGFVGAFAGLAVLAARRRYRWRPFADFVVSGVPLGHALGRIGCFLNGCCYGAPTGRPWAVVFGGEPRHPVQLYEAAANLLLYGLLRAWYPRRSRDGTVLALYAIGYGAVRLGTETLRGDPRLAASGFTAAQLVSLALIAAGALGWAALPRRRETFHADGAGAR